MEVNKCQENLSRAIMKKLEEIEKHIKEKESSFKEIAGYLSW